MISNECINIYNFASVKRLQITIGTKVNKFFYLLKENVHWSLLSAIMNFKFIKNNEDVNFQKLYVSRLFYF